MHDFIAAFLDLNRMNDSRVSCAKIFRRKSENESIKTDVDSSKIMHVLKISRNQPQIYCQSNFFFAYN